MGFPGGSVEESTCQCKRYRFDPWVGKIPWRRKWQPTPVFLTGKSHGQRRLAGYYCSCGRKESDTTEQLIWSDLKVYVSMLFSQVIPPSPSPTESKSLFFMYQNFISFGGLVAKSCPTLATPWTVAHQAPLSMAFSSQEYWSGLPFLSPGDLPWPRDRTRVSCTAGRFLTSWATREAPCSWFLLIAEWYPTVTWVPHCPG